jgi:hypothetical protein
MRQLFSEEATARTPGGTAVGQAALIAQVQRNHRPEDKIQHLTTNMLVDIDGDRARIRANLVVHFASPAVGDNAAPAPRVCYTLGEVYRFDAVRTRQGWRFSRGDRSGVDVGRVRSRRVHSTAEVADARTHDGFRAR